MINYKQLFILILIICFISKSAFSQEKHSYYSNHKIGFIFGYGKQDVHLLGIEIDLKVPYIYEVQLFEIDYFLPLYINSSWSIESHLRLVYGITHYQQNKRSLKEIKNNEVGISSGFFISRSFFNNFIKVYFATSLGPFYSKGTPDRQVSGFMFCGNYDIGINLELRKHVYLDLRTGFRHLSNAGLRKPNGGLNSWMVNGGIIFEM